MNHKHGHSFRHFGLSCANACTLMTFSLFLFGCHLSDQTTTPSISPALIDLPVSHQSLFVANSARNSEQYIRNHLINTYTKPQANVPMTQEAVADITSSNTLSTTNTLEETVDEADLIKAFTLENQDYLVTITQPDRVHFYATDESSVDNYKREKTAATVNLFSIDTSPSSQLLSSTPLNEDAYYVSGIYSHETTSSDNTSPTHPQIIAQTSLWQAPEDWSNHQAWGFGRSGIESTQLSITDNVHELSNTWSIVFDGHILDSRRIDNNMYVALRHYSHISGLDMPYYDTDEENEAVIANNIEKIEQLDIKSLLPNISLTYADNERNNHTYPAFDLELCYLPNDEARYLSGSVMFNYIAKIDLDSGQITGMQCVLADVNQLYMNEQSLFLIDSNAWYGQTSRLHRFNLNDLSYDTSLTLNGTLGWRSAEFRLKELQDGTVVTVTSQAENETTPWCCFFNNEWTHKLLLFQKDDTQTYAKIAELPNESYPDNDDTPLSLGKAGEDIYGVRIDESSVKVVTFQLTDPLYVFDISDRANPVSIGELEDAGFSAYLHNFGELTLGVGFNADEFGRRQGLKVELYKTDANVEDGIISLDEHSFGTYASTPLEWDHHAFASLDINDHETRIAIPTDIYEGYDWDYTGLLLFSLDKSNETLTFDGAIKTPATNEWGWASSWSDRAVIQSSTQGDAVHYIHLGNVISKRWDDVAE